MRPIALAVAFLLELVAFFAFAGAGFLLPGGRFVRWLAALLLFAALITFWSLFMAPRAPRKVGIVPYYTAKGCIYAVAAYVIFVFAGPPFGVAFIAAVLLDEALLFRHNLSR